MTTIGKQGAASQLTPYDTGERCEPKLWQPDRASVRVDMADDEAATNIGNVDFDDDCGDTVCCIRVVRKPDNRYRVHIVSMVAVSDLDVEIDCGDEITVLSVDHDIMADGQHNI